MGQLDGKAVFITGAASGMGSATAVLAAREGAKVLLADIDDKGLAATELEIRREGGVARTLITDVSRKRDCEQMADVVVREYGRLDGAVCAAAIVRPRPALEATPEDWAAVLAVNLYGTLFAVQAAARVILKAGTSGSVVTFSSALAVLGKSGNSPYVASKAAVIGLTKSLAHEFGPKGIRFNAVAPGVVDTPMTRGSFTDEQLGAWAAGVPLGRIGQPMEVAMAVVFLLSDASNLMTGQTIHVNGGFVMP